MKAYIIETIDNSTQIGNTAKTKYSVEVSQGAGVGIWRRKLAITSKKELDKRLNELKDRNVTVLSFSSDAAALAYARDTQNYLNS